MTDTPGSRMCISWVFLFRGLISTPLQSRVQSLTAKCVRNQSSAFRLLHSEISASYFGGLPCTVWEAGCAPAPGWGAADT